MSLLFYYNPDCALEFVVRRQYAKIASAHTRFFDEGIVHPILRRKIEYVFDITADWFCNRISNAQSGFKNIDDEFGSLRYIYDPNATSKRIPKISQRLAIIQ